MSARCPFERLIVAGTHGCSRAIAVARREGPGTDCNDAEACGRCQRLQELFEQVGAEAFGEVEDRTQVSHSTLRNIQIGGLAGMCLCLGRPFEGRLEDIDEVAGMTADLFDGLDPKILADMMRSMRGTRRRRH